MLRIFQRLSCIIKKPPTQSIRTYLPHPGQVPVGIPADIRVLLMSSAINNLTYRIQHELERAKAQCYAVEATSTDKMIEAVQTTNPDIILCPFLVDKIPAEIYAKQDRPCIIVHPGIPGDKGAYSLDFAILDDSPAWGVTLLQAEEEFDAGSIWSTETFAMPKNQTKTSLYSGNISDAAVRCALDAVSRFSQGIKPVPLDEELRGQKMRVMKKMDRMIDWMMPAEEISRIIRMSDTRPGAIASLPVDKARTETFRIFDASIETGNSSVEIKRLLKTHNPGEIIAKRHGKLLIKTGSNEGIWVGQMKKGTDPHALKIPAETNFYQGTTSPLPHISTPCVCDDIRVNIVDDVANVYFDFYNGAMNTQQGIRLLETIENVKRMDDVQVVALHGGERFFSTGIHLKTIEASSDKQAEARANIIAIDDVILSIINMTDKISVAVLTGNAGAGGVMFAAACDLVVSHPGVLLTPTYKAMHLYGSEYWTYFFPRRVGQANAEKIMADTKPISVWKALSYGLIDHIEPGDKQTFLEAMPDFLKEIKDTGTARVLMREKRAARNHDWSQVIREHRRKELDHMTDDFCSKAFLKSLSEFVYK